MGEVANEMIERVAASLELSFKSVITAMAGIDFDETGVVTPAPDVWRGYARAAIEEMRSPTFEMIEAGQETNNLLENPDPPNAFKFLSRDEMTGAWEAMIDAALK